jgi:ABC-2 type transport system ATP-binding protein
MGFLPQDPVIYDELTGTEFLRFVRDLYGVGRPGEARHLGRLARAGVGGWVDAPIRTYSAGMRKKIAVLASLLPDPIFWILDEPFAGLDGMGAQLLEEEIKRRRDCGGLVLLTAHDLGLVGPLADRVSVLQRGRMIFQGTVPSFEGMRLDTLGIASAPAAGSAP